MTHNVLQDANARQTSQYIITAFVWKLINAPISRMFVQAIVQLSMMVAMIARV